MSLNKEKLEAMDDVNKFETSLPPDPYVGLSDEERKKKVLAFLEMLRSLLCTDSPRSALYSGKLIYTLCHGYAFCIWSHSWIERTSVTRESWDWQTTPESLPDSTILPLRFSSSATVRVIRPSSFLC